MENRYRSIISLKAIKVLNTLQEAFLDYMQEEIDQNIRVSKLKLSSSLTKLDASLYDSIKKNLESIKSDLTWYDLEASTVLSDESPLVNCKETGPELEKKIEQILNILAEIWNNPAFTTSEFRNVPHICLSMAKWQSLASKARKNAEADKEQMRKKPDIMVLDQYMDKIIKLTYVECSRIICNTTKKANDEVKL
ncbi:hypothetical protein GLOIN_2v1776328 [Rhizophagus clarus]|uniref:Uncharacterized protein n=2 Tax=Rhizophagus clarus TaxID=94130 RepID=A0A8H3QV24_9GLOM|nr:hypothetical protein GLOIN_2v1776328 [Rhizophagus clarus]